MGFGIQDGTGSGRMARIDEKNRLEVISVSVPIITQAAHDGDAYAIRGSHTIEVTDTEENVLHVTNDNPAAYLYIHNLHFSIKTSTGVVGKSYFGATRTSGGTVKTAINMNRGVAKEALLTAYDNSSDDLVLSVDSDLEFELLRGSTTQTVCARSGGSIILGPGDAFAFRAIGTAGDIVELSVFVFEGHL